MRVVSFFAQRAFVKFLIKNKLFVGSCFIFKLRRSRGRRHKQRANTFFSCSCRDERKKPTRFSLSPASLSPVLRLRDGRARRCSRAGVRAPRSRGILRFLQGPESVMVVFRWHRFFFFFFFQRSLKSPPLANLLSRKKFFLTARFSSLPFPKTTDLCPARLHPLRPLLQVLRRELCRRHRPADGGLLDREFFIAVFSLSLFSLSSPLRLALPPSLSLSLSHSLSLPPKPNPKTKTK